MNGVKWGLVQAFVLVSFIVAALPVFSQSQSTKPAATVYVFLAETCPISQQATLALRNLSTAYASRGVRFVGLFPDQQTSTADILPRLAAAIKCLSR